MYSTIFYGIGDACTSMFKLLPPIGLAVDLTFVCLIAAGSAYWIIYGIGIENGKENFLAEHGDKQS